MNREEILAMKGRELDAAVAEFVGEKNGAYIRRLVKTEDRDGRPVFHVEKGEPLHFSASTSSAFRIEEEIQRRGLSRYYAEALSLTVLGKDTGGYVHALSMHEIGRLLMATPEQKCRAALLALYMEAPSVKAGNEIMTSHGFGFKTPVESLRNKDAKLTTPDGVEIPNPPAGRLVLPKEPNALTFTATEPQDNSSLYLDAFCMRVSQRLGADYAVQWNAGAPGVFSFWTMRGNKTLAVVTLYEADGLSEEESIAYVVKRVHEAEMQHPGGLKTITFTAKKLPLNLPYPPELAGALPMPNLTGDAEGDEDDPAKPEQDKPVDIQAIGNSVAIVAEKLLQDKGYAQPGVSFAAEWFDEEGHNHGPIFRTILNAEGRRRLCLQNVSEETLTTGDKGMLAKMIAHTADAELKQALAACTHRFVRPAVTLAPNGASRAAAYCDSCGAEVPMEIKVSQEDLSNGTTIVAVKLENKPADSKSAEPKQETWRDRPSLLG